MAHEKICVVCNKAFAVPPSRVNTAKTCSSVCGGILQAKRYADARIKKTCPVCGTEFYVPKCHEVRAVCCSISCANKMPTRKRSEGENHYLWNGGKTTHRDGYLYMRVAGHPYVTTLGNYVFQHRVVMEEAMRNEAPSHRFLVEHDGVKYLRPEISVHHINENRADNRLENLIACTQGAHRAMHRGIPPMCGESWPEPDRLLPFQPYRMKRLCSACGIEFISKRSSVNAGGGKYCSRSCYNSSRVKQKM